MARSFHPPFCKQKSRRRRWGVHIEVTSALLLSLKRHRKTDTMLVSTSPIIPPVGSLSSGSDRGKQGSQFFWEWWPLVNWVILCWWKPPANKWGGQPSFGKSHVGRRGAGDLIQVTPLDSPTLPVSRPYDISSDITTLWLLHVKRKTLCGPRGALSYNTACEQYKLETHFLLKVTIAPFLSTCGNPSCHEGIRNKVHSSCIVQIWLL